jgi:hypothetical protein
MKLSVNKKLTDRHSSLKMVEIEQVLSGSPFHMIVSQTAQISDPGTLKNQEKPILFAQAGIHLVKLMVKMPAWMLLVRTFSPLVAPIRQSQFLIYSND